jgi:uncharacterized protein YjgD (DUF1641 family)
MAEPIEYTPEPPKIGPDAHEELERLLQTAHEHGVLRLANDLIGANTQWAQVLVDGMNTEGARSAVQNVAALAMVLGSIPPDQFYKLLFAVKDSLEHVSRLEPVEETSRPPGVAGAYKLLYDQELWNAITPIIEALQIFSARLNREVDKPISDFTGKPARGP